MSKFSQGLQFLDGQTGQREIYVLRAFNRRFQSSKIASTFVQYFVLRGLVLFESDQRRLSAADS